MSDPVTWAYIATAASATATVSNMAAAQQQASAQNQMYQYQAAVAQNNQTIANANADLALKQGQAQEAAKREQTAQAEGNIRAVMGASGMDAGFGTASRLQGDTANLGETDALTIRSNSQNTATGYRNQGLNFAGQASMDQAAASNALTAGNLNTFSSFAGGASSVANTYKKYN